MLCALLLTPTGFAQEERDITALTVLSGKVAKIWRVVSCSFSSLYILFQHHLVVHKALVVAGQILSLQCWMSLSVEEAAALCVLPIMRMLPVTTL